MVEIFETKPIIKEEEKEAYVNHKFAGGDFGIFYVYVASPLCDYIINFIPTSIA